LLREFWRLFWSGVADCCACGTRTLCGFGMAINVPPIDVEILLPENDSQLEMIGRNRSLMQVVVHFD